MERKEEGERKDGDSGRKPRGFTIPFNINKSEWVHMVGKRERETERRVR